MVAVDTSVLVRFFTGDDAREATRAFDAMRSGEIWVSKTVLLETEWVLRSAYGFAAGPIAAVLQRLVGTANVSVEDPVAVAKALEWFAGGLDFADALHLASSAHAGEFVTLDEKLARWARK